MYTISEYLRSITAKKDWSEAVKTHPLHQKGLFKQSPETIAKKMSDISKGKKQAIERIQFYINRAGKNLPKDRRGTLERAIQILDKK